MSANRKWLFATAALGVVAIVLGFLCWNQSQRDACIPPLSLVGDIKNCATIHHLDQIGTPQHIKIGNASYRAVKLSEILNKAQPDGQTKELYFSSNDGFTVCIAADSIEQSYLSFGQNGWEVLNPNHPISANAKFLSEILIVSDGASESGFDIISQDMQIATSVGALYIGAIDSYLFYEGQANTKINETGYSSQVYTRRCGVTLERLGVTDANKMLLFCLDGSTILTDGTGTFELNGNRVRYLNHNTREQMDGVRYAMIGPPTASIADIYYHAAQYLKQNNTVLLLLASDLRQTAHSLSYLHDDFQASFAAGAYPIQKETWLELMFTGQSSAQNKKAASQTLMQKADELNKKAMFINCPSAQIIKDYEAKYLQLPNIIAELKNAEDKDYGLIVLELDADMLQDLEQSLLDFDGAVIVASLPPEHQKQNFSYSDLCTTYYILRK